MIRYILMDIEGTTTSLHFIQQVLFPYSASELPGWVNAHHHEPRVQEVIQEVIATVAEENSRKIDEAGAVEELLGWIKADRKHPALKRLQGWIWREGYETGAYKGHVYPDVRPAMEAWREAGIGVGIYSSGSVEAQQLLFGFSVEGDMLPLIDHHFDTAVGAKREVGSYRKIQEQIGIPAAEMMFLSDVAEELDGARAASFHTIQLVRPGTKISDRHTSVKDFSEIKVSPAK